MEGRAPRASGDRGTFVGLAELQPPPPTIPLSILLPNTSQIILDKVFVLDKGTASVNAPPPLHGKIVTISYYAISHSTQP